MGSPRGVIRSLEPDDLEAAVGVTESVGWGDRTVHWGLFLDWAGPGALGLFVGGDLVATGCAFCYGEALAWLGCIATRPEYQREGYGTRLTAALVEHAQKQGIERVMLDAGAQGREMYARLGFRALASLERWRGVGTAVATPKSSRYSEDDLPAIVHLDGMNYGAERPRILQDILETSSKTSWVIHEGDRVAGYAVLKAWIPGGAAHLGPWYAKVPEQAAALLETALGAWVGRSLYMDIPGDNAPAKRIASQLGLRRDGGATRMIHGNANPPQDPWRGQYSIAMRATG